ncbi:MAG: hypothetical protein ACT4NX_02170 [Deltaproteobacteria bacterium]
MPKFVPARENEIYRLNPLDAASQSGWRIKPAEIKLGSQLLDMQIWRWGLDIKRPEGNLLLEQDSPATEHRRES